jgi:hypothetical protein
MLPPAKRSGQSLLQKMPVEQGIKILVVHISAGMDGSLLSCYQIPCVGLQHSERVLSNYNPPFHHLFHFEDSKHQVPQSRLELIV